ncbi:MAG: hypothetical protein AAF491_11650 [Verrucomicrobiota bacterium]
MDHNTRETLIRRLRIQDDEAAGGDIQPNDFGCRRNSYLILWICIPEEEKKDVKQALQPSV